MKKIHTNSWRTICWFPTDEEIGGNTFFKRPEATQAIKNIAHIAQLRFLVEPNYGSTGTCAYIRNIKQVELLNPFANLIPLSDGICMEHDFMQEENIGIFIRCSDCLPLCISTEKDVRVLHISVESINNGILMNLPTSFEYAEAILGPCICKEHLTYDLSDKRIGTAARDEPSPNKTFVGRVSHYKTLGYDEFITFDEVNQQAHVDIKGIVKKELMQAGIPITYDDERCTVCDNLGSHRLKNKKANAMVVYN